LEKEHKDINKKLWNNKVEHHVGSEFYNMKEFLKGSTSLNQIEINLLGEIRNKKVLHLQCHFGQDSISLSRMGAEVVGVDFSEKAISKANELAEKEDVKVRFICSDVYELKNNLNEKFDVVYTSYGVIGWLPDLDRWAEIISTFLKPNGKFIFIEFHPFVWLFDDNFKCIENNYFNRGPVKDKETGTYADREAKIEQDYIWWNHSISEVLSSLIDNSIKLESFSEYDYSPYPCFKNTVEFELCKYRIKHLGNKIPMVYSLVGRKTD